MNFVVKFFKKIRSFSAFDELEKKIIPLIAWFVIQLISRTLKIKKINFEKISSLKSKIYAFFHGEQFLLVFTHKHRNIVIITSLSKDGELQTKILSKFGYDIVRGSSSKKGATSGTLSMIEKIKIGKSCAIAVDGPHGPVFKVKPGIIFLAQKTNSPIIPTRVVVKNKIQLKNWDKYIIPIPFSKCCIIYGDPIYIKENENIKTKIKEVEQALKSIVIPNIFK